MKKIYLILFLIISLSLVAYYFLGGFKVVEKSIITSSTNNIVGTYYEGKIGSDTLQQLFIQAKEIVEADEHAIAVAIVYYGETNPATGQVKNFIGYTTTNGLSEKSPLGWELRKFQSSLSVQGCIEANPLAMPTPEDMLENLRNYAAENEIATGEIFIEYYRGPNNLCVELMGAK